MNDTVLVTAALPYANGSIHLGHLVEYIMTDIYVRALRMAGSEAIYICADDTHGTPIELNARRAGVTPEAFVARFAREHVDDLAGFEIRFDSFYSTHSDENRKWVHLIYEALKEKGHIHRKPLQQLYDEQAGQFLPDRFVKGTCPNCSARDQYGDVCEVCGATYEPTELIEPYSVLTNSRPVLRSSEHIFVQLSDFEDFLRDWVTTQGRLQAGVRNFAMGWIDGGLRDWCISRDAPYFGFEIPGEDKKYFYVWLDAPVGYIASTEAWAQSIGTPKRAETMWRDGNMRLVHVIGKDIVYFHTLFWPAMLHNAGLKVPDRVQVHGFLTVEGEKMSKTRGTFVNARTFLDHLDPTYLRWFYGSRLGSGSDDIDLSAEEFTKIVNAELVNNVANLVSRGTKFLTGRLGGQYAASVPDVEIHRQTIAQAIERAIQRYENFDLSRAVGEGVQLANLGNRLFQEGEPWKTVKDEPERARDLVTLCLNIARASIVLLAPIVPGFASKAYAMLGLPSEPQAFEEALRMDLCDRSVGSGGVLAPRVQKQDLERMFDASKPAAEPQNPEPNETISIEPIAAEIEIDRFGEIDLRVGVIESATPVEGAKKLLELQVDLGEGRLRTIFAGLAQAYAGSDLKKRRVLVVANLKPRKMRFGVSEGMILAAGSGGSDLQLVEVGEGAAPGSKVS